jgi:hypothetical protein
VPGGDMKPRPPVHWRRRRLLHGQRMIRV